MFYKEEAELMKNALVQDRLNARYLYNQNKPILRSENVIEVPNFYFQESPFTRIGDSGKLLIATNKENNQEKYLVKHEFIDCACNEFMYSQLGRLLGVPYLDVKFFNTLTPPLPDIFSTEDVIGIKYIELKDNHFHFEKSKDQCKNKQDFFKYLAISKLFFDDDSYEIVLDHNGYIYKVDNTCSFCISSFTLQSIYIEFEKEIEGRLINIEEFTKKQFLQKLEYYKKQTFIDYDKTFHMVTTQYGEEGKKYFLEPFYCLSAFHVNEMDSILNVLCYFYPDYVGDYYKEYIKITKEKVDDFLKRII